MIILSRRNALVPAIAAATALLGAIVALHYHRLGLTLSHYDSRGHLVVARRIADSITPGWQQIGAVWLPLPHLLNFLPAQIDLLYRTGLAAVVMSIGAFAAGAGAIAWIVRRLTGSAAAAVVGTAVFALNPNVLYLQATPMTEPLLLALTLVAVALLIRGTSPDDGAGLQRHVAGPQPGERQDAAVGWTLALACMTRYEAWPVTICALLAAVYAWWRSGLGFPASCRRAAAIAVYPATAVAAFAIYSRVVIGEWFTTSGFFVPENKALGRPLVAAAEIWWGAHALSGSLTIAIAAIGFAALLVTATVSRRRAASLIPLALLASAALPWAAFVRGHPFRIRYMVPLIAVEAIGAGAAVGVVRRAALASALVVAAALAFDIRPLDPSAPMVLEAQWDVPNLPAREAITRCLRASYDGETIMASMGSLGHYMQEAANSGFAVRNFLHEGNGDIWLAALDGPRPYAGWLMIEEKAEGGDMLARIARANPSFLDGYDRVCAGAGLALYRRTAAQRPAAND
jgi:hypothetical protein